MRPTYRGQEAPRKPDWIATYSETNKETYSCPVCHAVVLDGHRGQHMVWHEVVNP